MDDVRVARQVLMLEGDEPITRDRLRRAYMRQLRKFPPERDPDGFRRLREALELVEKQIAWEEIRAKLEAARERNQRAVEAEDADAHAHAAPPVADVRAHTEPLVVVVASPLFPVAPRPTTVPAPPADPDRALADLIAAALAHLEAGEINPALQLVGEWRKHPLDDRRVISAITAQHWALTRDLLKIAMGLPASVLRGFAATIARDDLAPLRQAAIGYGGLRVGNLADMQAFLTKRAPNLRKLLDSALPGTDPSDLPARRTAAYADPPPTKPRWRAGPVVAVVLALSALPRVACHAHDPQPSQAIPANLHVDLPRLDEDVRLGLITRLDGAATDATLDADRRTAAHNLSQLLLDNAPCPQLRPALHLVTSGGHLDDALSITATSDLQLLCP